MLGNEWTEKPGNGKSARFSGRYHQVKTLEYPFPVIGKEAARIVWQFGARPATGLLIFLYLGKMAEEVNYPASIHQIFQSPDGSAGLPRYNYRLFHKPGT